MWEESWDDDDTNEDFAKELRYVHAIFFVRGWKEGGEEWKRPGEDRKERRVYGGYTKEVVWVLRGNSSLCIVWVPKTA